MKPTEYIEREAAIAAIKAIPEGNWSNKRYVSELENIPAADVRPVLRGKWINIERIGFTTIEAECSVCGATCIYSQSWRKYCSYCGADMWGDKNGD